MGSMVHLTAGSVEIDWGKNQGLTYHNSLFREGDQTVGPYAYVNIDDGSPIVEYKQCLARPLGTLTRRLDLLGYSMAECELHYRVAMHSLAFEEGDPDNDFNKFVNVVRSLPWEEEGPHKDIARTARRAVESKLITAEDELMLVWAQSMHPYVLLRILADDPKFKSLPVRWLFADVVDGGWITEESVKPGPVSHGERWIVITEGTSDAFILKKSLNSLYPDLEDFFDFIDMTERNPFPGVGNIVALCRGLKVIGYAGRMLIVLDNDTAGRGALSEITALGIEHSVKAICLPNLDTLKNFRTWGPAGEGRDDINGRASAIECFLDLEMDNGSEPAVRWTAYDRKLQSYQGELIAKDDYTRYFKENFPREESYDSSKLRILWEYIFSVCAPAHGATVFEMYE